MNKNSLFFLFLSLVMIPSAFARKPAVEDFVGVEHEAYAESPQGTDVLFEFGNTVKAIKDDVKPGTYSKSGQAWSELTPVLALISFLLLPFAMWSAINRSVKNMESEVDPTENVAKLSDYKKENGSDGEKPSDDYEQAS